MPTQSGSFLHCRPCPGSGRLSRYRLWLGRDLEVDAELLGPALAKPQVAIVCHATERALRTQAKILKFQSKRLVIIIGA